MYKYFVAHKTYPEDIESVFEEKNGKTIFIGNLEAAQNLDTLKKHNIGAVLTAARSIHLYHSKSQIPYHLHILADDHEKFNIAQFFQESIYFIENSLRKTNILVHCMAGISRSVTLVLAYLIKRHSIPLKEALLKLRKKRKIINPNRGFLRQLEDFQKRINEEKHLYSLKNKPLKEINQDLAKSWREQEMYRTKPKRYQESSRLAQSRLRKSHIQSSDLNGWKKYDLSKRLQEMRKKRENEEKIEFNKELNEKIQQIRQKYLNYSSSRIKNTELKEKSFQYNTISQDKSSKNQNYPSGARNHFHQHKFKAIKTKISLNRTHNGSNKSYMHSTFFEY